MASEIISQKFLKKLEMFSIQSRRAFLGSKQGGHVSPRKGHGVEFSDYRQYELGDNPRYIDWSVYARTERLYVKQYREEEDLTVMIVLDGSSSMHVPDDGEKWDRAVALAQSLGYVALMNHDVVRLVVLGSDRVGVYSGPRAFSRLKSDLEDIVPLRSQPNRREIGNALTQARFPGVVCFISDFLFDFKDIEQILLLPRSKNYAVSLLHIIGKEDSEPFSVGEAVVAEDSETLSTVDLNWDKGTQESYAKLFNDHVGNIMRYARSAGMEYLLVRPQVNIEDVILKGLPRIGILKG